MTLFKRRSPPNKILLHGSHNFLSRIELLTKRLKRMVCKKLVVPVSTQSPKTYSRSTIQVLMCLREMKNMTNTHTKDMIVTKANSVK